METKTLAPLERFRDEPRLEDDVLVRGAGRFVDDITLPGMLHAVVVRSVHAHARILSIDTSEAGAMPGVVSVSTARDLTGLDNLIPPIPRDDIVYDNAPGHPILAEEKVSYVGQPVAIVVAEELAVSREGPARPLPVHEPGPGFPVAFDRGLGADGRGWVLFFKLGQNAGH